MQTAVTAQSWEISPIPGRIRNPYLVIFQSSESGETVLTARIDPGMRRGVVSICHAHLNWNVNRLASKSAIDTISGMALFSGAPIEIKPAS